MIRALPLLVAAAAVRPGCLQPSPRARVEVVTLDASKPPLAWVTCRTVGLRAPVKVTWTLAPPLKQAGWNLPKDEAALLVQLPERHAATATQGGLQVACEALGDDGQRAEAAAVLGPLSLSAVTLDAELVTVTGSGFGAAPLPPSGDDGVWLVPAHGRALRADSACPKAAWTAGRAVACLPPELRGERFGARGPVELRLQSGGRLAVWPKPLEVAAQAGAMSAR